MLRFKKGTVVQIGSNDGKTGDPIYDWLKRNERWRAVFVEPVPYLFERLRNNYRNETRFSFENVVINDGSDVDFYWVLQEAKQQLSDLPYWYDQLGGFSRSHITDRIPELEPYIQHSILPGMSLSTLLERHQIKDLNLLHIDAEGADFQILSQLDLSRHRPYLILYERRHLGEEQEKESIRFLRSNYRLFDFGADILAVRIKGSGWNWRSQTALRDIGALDS